MVEDADGYELIDWQCGVQHYADKIGIKVYRKPTYKDKLDTWDIRCYKDDKILVQYFALTWDFVGCLLDFADRYHLYEVNKQLLWDLDSPANTHCHPGCLYNFEYLGVHSCLKWGHYPIKNPKQIVCSFGKAGQEYAVPRSQRGKRP